MMMKKYRDPSQYGSKEAELVEAFKMAGITLRIEQAEIGEHRLLLFTEYREEVFCEVRE